MVTFSEYKTRNVCRARCPTSINQHNLITFHCILLTSFMPFHISVHVSCSLMYDPLVCTMIFEQKNNERVGPIVRRWAATHNGPARTRYRRLPLCSAPARRGTSWRRHTRVYTFGTINNSEHWPMLHPMLQVFNTTFKWGLLSWFSPKSAVDITSICKCAINTRVLILFRSASSEHLP